MSDRFPALNPKEHEELFRITDSIRALGMRTRTLTRGEYVSIMREACNALSVSLKRGLEEAIGALADASKDRKRAEEVLGIIRDADRFAGFLEFEKQILAECGLSQMAIEGIVNDLRDFRQVALKEGFPDDLTNINAERLLSAIKRLRDRACATAEQMEKVVGDMKEKYDDRVFGFQISGVTLVAADLTILAASAGTLTAFSAISGGAGGLMLTWEKLFLRDPTKE